MAGDLIPEDTEPLGATATVAGVLAAREWGPVRERVHVWVTGLAGRASYVTVEDATGIMLVRWPSSAGPARPEAFTDVELDLRSGPSMRRDPAQLAALEEAHREASDQAQAGDLEAARRAAARLAGGLDHQAVDAEVVAARRLR